MKWQQKSNSNFKNSLWCFENAVLAIELNLPSTIDTGESSVWWKWPGYRLPGTSGVYRRYCYNACMWGGWKINRQMVSGASSLLFCPREENWHERGSKSRRSRRVASLAPSNRRSTHAPENYFRLWSPNFKLVVYVPYLNRLMKFYRFVVHAIMKNNKPMVS